MFHLVLQPVNMDHGLIWREEDQEWIQVIRH